MTAVANITVSQPSPVVATANASAILCNGGNSSVTVSATGSVGPYTGTGTFSRIAGSYSFTVRDSNNCATVANVTISQPSALAVTATAGAATGALGSGLPQQPVAEQPARVDGAAGDPGAAGLRRRAGDLLPLRPRESSR